MANLSPVALRTGAVRVYGSFTELYRDVAARFGLRFDTLIRRAQPCVAGNYKGNTYEPTE
jgi:hypothetical protein